MSTDPTPIPAEALDLDALMDLATPLLREAFDEMPPEQAAVTALGRRIRAEVERIYVAGRTAAAADLEAHAESIGWYEGGGVWADAIEVVKGANRAARVAEHGPQSRADR